MKPKHLASVISAAAVLSAPLWSTAAAQAATTNSNVTYVSNSGSDTSGTGSSASPYQTIGHAVSEAAPNSTIVVEPGTYKESIQITKDVTLESDTSQANAAANTIIDATGLDNGIFVDGPSAQGTVINGFTVENANNHGIWVRNTSHVTVENNVVVNNGINPTKTSTTAIPENKPILLDGTAYSVVSGNTVKNNKADGGISVSDYGAFDPGAPEPIKPGPPPAGAPAVASVPGIGNVVIHNNIDTNAGGCGVVVAAYNPGGGVIDNEVIGNTINKIVAGIVVAADSPHTVAKNNVVLNNTITNNFIPGVIIHSNTPGDVVDGNVVAGNTISGNGPDKATGDMSPTGIVLAGEVNPVTNTVVSNNTISNETYGIWAKNAPGSHVSDNRSASSVSIPAFGLTPSVEVDLNGQATAAFPKVVANNATYIPVWNVMQLAKTLGVTSQWNGKQLSLTTSKTGKPHAPKLGMGNMGISINGVEVASVQGFDAPNGRGQTAYMPIAALSQVMTSLGYQNSWDGVAWSITK
ncbi:right-handed parallel beta-helix repeat-containing protein [Alicyclobacillus tolerans]|uniref:right-handed parallel beta-helix repeat-containing protein n=1 Tax=Alicyclobacillus tolerans TaxID=90970 RepID=UPI001F3B4F49|nr:right-handed parallel beta-helix repeat-containing protein [Alicyclobacillus tolerans]MCF8565073.1 right-handed parallel beta-helix repeat-containing protein [Alicyclobacillus tolerans]